MDKPAMNYRLMRHAQPVSIFPRGSMTRKAFRSVAVVCVLAAPATSPAQDAGVSGIAPGPANARGLNGSVNDPSGIGNASRVPAISPPTITPVTPPTLSPPATAYRTLPVQRVAKIRRTRPAASRSRRAPARKATSEQDKPVETKIPSICKGC
jgi:hypothetical protein